MKKIEVIVARILIYISYIVTILIPVKKNRVSIISYFNKDLGLEYTKLVDLLQSNNYEIRYDMHKFNANLWGKFKYLFSFMHQTYLFNTSRLVILDGNSFVYANIKTKKRVHTMQLWHATGAIKCFGMDSNRRYEIKGYDSLIVGSEFFKSIFSKALNTSIENTHALGICKTDYLFDEEYKQEKISYFYKQYPELKNKKIVLYAPTFRGEGIEDMNCGTSNVNQLEESLNDEYQLIVKFHPLAKENQEKYMYDMSKEELYTLLFVAEFVISDYSALVYDAALLNKNIIMYLYDIKAYQESRGLCVDINDFSFEKSYNINELSNAIINFEKQDYTDFNNKYLAMNNGQSHTNVYKFIESIVKEG